MIRTRHVSWVAALALIGAACSDDPEQPLPGAPEVDVPTQPTNQNPFNLTGRGQSGAAVAVRGGEGAVATGNVNPNGQFTVPVQLKPNQKNTLIVSLSNRTGEGSPTIVEVTHDGEAPDTPVVNQVVSPTRVNRQRVRGTTEAGATVTITGGQEEATGQAGEDGRFEVEVVLNASSTPTTINDLQVTATDVAGNTSSPAIVTIEVDPSLPVQAPELDSLPAATNQASIDVAGTAEPGAGLSIVGGASTRSGTAGNDGRFSVSVPLKANQENTLLVFAIGSGVTSEPTTATITHDDIAPAEPMVDDPVTPTGATAITLTGSAEPRATIVVTGGQGTATDAADEFGNFAVDVTLNSAQSSTTTNELVVVARDAAGNSSGSVSKTVVQDPNLESPIVVDAVPSPTRDATVTFTGSSQAGATVSVAGGKDPASAVVDQNGRFSVDVNLNANTSNDLTFSRAGGTVDTIVTIVHDDTPPAMPTLNAVATPTNRRNIEITGTSEAGARIAVTGASAPANGTANANGQFSVPVTLKEDVANTILVVATDKATNVSDPATITVTHSSTVPNAPEVNQLNPAPTKSATYTVAGRVTPPNAATTITIKGGAAEATGATDGTTGTFSIPVTLTENATNELRVTSTTGAIESPETIVTVVHDDQAPAAADASKVAVGTPGVCFLGGRSSASVTGQDGSVEAGATVKIVNTSNGNASVTVAATSQGSFTRSLSLCRNEVLRITVIDAAGNESSHIEKTAP